MTLRAYSAPRSFLPVQPSHAHQGKRLWTWLVCDWHWPVAALCAASFLLILLPLFALYAGIALALVFLQLPIYMLHQWEEHADDRFRRYVNRVMASGREVLTPGATFWINCLGVWAVDLLALYLAWLVAPAAGLVAGYLTLVNGMIHIGQTFVRGDYNPGFGTALVLFIPLGGWCVWEVGSTAGLWAHALGLGAAVGLHLAIIAYVVLRLKRLSRKV